MSTLDQLWTSGRILLGGCAVGLAGVLWRWYGVDMGSEGTLVTASVSVAGVDCWEGKIALLGLLAAGGTFVHGAITPIDAPRKALYRRVQVVGSTAAVATTLIFWLGADSMSTPFARAGLGPGFYLTLLGAGAAALESWRRRAPAAGDPSPPMPTPPPPPPPKEGV